MNKRIKDISGKIFGRLRVIELDRLENHRTRWWCLCDPLLGGCGNKKSILSGNLISGDIVSCGCFKKEKNSKKKTESLIGKRFGSLLVTDNAEDYVYPNQKAKSSQYLCKCDCGNDFIVLGQRLRSGITTSCGCLSHPIIDIKDKKFGMLNVIELHHIDKHHGAYWLCKCDCGNVKVFYGSSLRSGKLSSCGCLNESLIASDLKKYFRENYNSISEYKAFINKKTNRWLFYDIYIPENIFIEVHGGQHYFFVPYFHGTEENFKYRCELDKDKKSFAKKHGVYIEINLLKIKTTQEAIEYIERIIEKTLSK